MGLLQALSNRGDLIRKMGKASKRIFSGLNWSSCAKKFQVDNLDAGAIIFSSQEA